MKKIYTLLLVFIFTAHFFKAQPCSGTPATNTVMAQSYTVCSGSAVSMNLAASYSTSGISYQWQSSTTSSVGPFTSIPGATLTTYTSGSLTVLTWFRVAITCTNSSQTIYATRVFSVVSCATPCNGSPAPSTIIPATQSVCASDVAAMSLNYTYTNTGITFQWGSASSAAGPYSAIPGATLSNYTSAPLTSNGFYNVLITCANSSGTFATTHSVSVVSCTYCAGTPASNTILPLSHTVCAGSAASMSLANTYTASGIAYQWQSSTTSSVGPFVSIPGATLANYTSAPLAGNTWFRAVITCTNSSQSISVPHAVSVLTCTSPCVANASFTLQPTSTPKVWNAIPASNASVAAATWQWGDGSSSNTLITSHQYSAAGQYSICLSITLTCGAQASSCATYSIFRGSEDIIQVNVIDPNTVSISENSLAETVSVYPNPGTGIFYLRFSDVSGNASVQVRNLVGQLVYRQEAAINDSRSLELDLSALQSGIYFIEIGKGAASLTKKISLQK